MIMRIIIQFRVGVFLLACAALAGSAVAQEAGWTPDVMITFKRVGGTAISPDGKLIAYTVSTPLMEGEKSEFLTHVWVVSADGKQNYQFTFGEKSCANPEFSPDGRYLSFTSSRGSDGKNQIWILRLSGGEAEQVTKAKSGVGSYRWSPDAKHIAFTMTDPPSDLEEKEKKEKRDMQVVDADYKYAHLYTVSVEKDGKGDRTSKRVTAGTFHVTSFDWSPDGKTIVFSHQPNPTVDVWPSTKISLVPSDSGTVSSLVSRPGWNSSPVYSPDGAWIAFASDNGDTKWARAFDVYLIPSAGGQPRKLGETPDRSFGIIGWSADGKEVYVSETDRTSPRIYAVPVNGSKPRRITTGRGNYSGVSFSRDGTMMSFVHQQPEQAPDVYLSSVRKFEPKKLTSVNADFPKPPMGKTEVITWTSRDGKQIEGLLTYPVNYEPGRTYPLILNIHGGPAGVFTQNFTAAGATYPLQAFAQEGYAILRPNPRGSSGYGAEFRRANISDWGFGDFDDNETGIEKVIEMGVAHPDSLVICGWSYGGYMTSFTITRTNRFKAASVGAGVTNLMSFVGTADIPSFLPSYFEGEFWDRMDVYMKHSAMFNVKNIRTPAQILHGERDARVPLSQGQELYIALKRLDVPTEMIVYPRMPHGLQEPKFIADAGQRMIDWFNRQLKRNGAVERVGSE
jgi:dipeptidyl aminopeptidase/acylaminoacyl peptidase